VNRIRSRREGGAAALEFTLVGVFLFIPLLFAMIQYSMFFWSTQSAANAARDAARRGAVGQTCADLQASVNANIKLVQTGTLTVQRRYYAATTTNYVLANEVSASNTANVRIVIVYNSTNLGFPFVPFFQNGAVRETSLAKVENYSATSPAANWSNCS
jgi:Flp pilus assembly protein TadG